MSVEVHLPNVLRVVAGGESSVKAEGATVGEVLHSLMDDYPEVVKQVFTEDGQLHRFVIVYVNDEDVRYLDGLDTKVEDGTSVWVRQAVAGG